MLLFPLLLIYIYILKKRKSKINEETVLDRMRHQ